MSHPVINLTGFPVPEDALAYLKDWTGDERLLVVDMEIPPREGFSTTYEQAQGLIDLINIQIEGMGDFIVLWPKVASPELGALFMLRFFGMVEGFPIIAGLVWTSDETYEIVEMHE